MNIVYNIPISQYQFGKIMKTFIRFPQTLLFISLLLLSACDKNTPLETQEKARTSTEASRLEAIVKVEGWVSKGEKIDIKYVGQDIPATYSANKIFNTPGYRWWISKHFAIKSDLPKEKVKLYLELLELSYPHYVALFGQAPADIGVKRIAVVYGSSREATKEAMFDDGFTRGVHQYAGGETMYYNRAGYSFPSHREQHQRYIVIHETMHAFHMALNGHSTWAPNWITEGLADAIASHVYDPERRQLKLMVFDRAPMNYIKTGLKQYYAAGQPTITAINNDPTLKRGLNFFIIHFLLADPTRAYYFALFRDRLMEANPHSEATLPTANQLLQSTFPNWAQLEAEFAQFVKQVHASFFIVKGPWEQDGANYWIRSYDPTQTARLDIRFPPAQQGENTLSRPAIRDAERETDQNLIVPTSRLKHLLNLEDSEKYLADTVAPTFLTGAVINYQSAQIKRGKIGLALGIQYSENNQLHLKDYNKDVPFEPNQDSLLQVLIDATNKVLLAPQNLNFSPYQFALSTTMQAAISQSNKLILNLFLVEQKLVLLLQSGDTMQSTSLPIEANIAEQLTTGHMALLVNNARHQIMPILAAHYPRVARPTHAADWTSNNKLYRVFKTCIEFQLDCEPSLSHLIKQLANVPQFKLNDQVEQLFQRVLHQIKDNEAALQALAGLRLSFTQTSSNLEVNVNWADEQPPKANMQLFPENSVQNAISVKPDLSKGHARFEFVDPMFQSATQVNFASKFNWRGHTFSSNQVVNLPLFDGLYLTVDHQIDAGMLTVSAQLTGPYSGLTNGQLVFELLPNALGLIGSSPAEVATDNHRTIRSVKLEPYQKKQWRATFKLDNKSNAIEVSANLDVDGEGIHLRQLIHLEPRLPTMEPTQARLGK